MTEKTSTITMSLTSSNGTWLNGALQPQHHFQDATLLSVDLARKYLTYLCDLKDPQQFQTHYWMNDEKARCET